MALNENLSKRIREALSHITDVKETRMFRGSLFMVNGKMCLTAGDDRMMCRIDPALYEAALKKKGCTPVLMKGRPYKGYVYINEANIKSKKDFDYWLNLALDFNATLKTTPKKKKKK